MTFSHLLVLLPGYVSPQESPWTEAPSRQHCNICALKLWCLIPLLRSSLQVLGKQGRFGGDSVSLTLCLGRLKQMHVSVWEKGKPATLAQGCSGSDPAENSRAPLSPGRASQDRMAALPCIGPCARFRAEGNQHHLSSSEMQPLTTLTVGKSHLLQVELQ